MSNYAIKVDKRYRKAYLHTYDTLPANPTGEAIPDSVLANVIIEWFDANTNATDSMTLTKGGKPKIKLIAYKEEDE